MPRMRIQANASQKWHLRCHIFRNQSAKKPHHPRGNKNAGQAAEQRQQESFGDKLAHQPQRRGAQCASNGNLAPAALRAHQYKARHVDAGDQQQQSGPAQQRQQDGPHIADDNLREGNNTGTQVAAGHRHTAAAVASRWPSSRPARPEP